MIISLFFGGGGPKQCYEVQGLHSIDIAVDKIRSCTRNIINVGEASGVKTINYCHDACT